MILACRCATERLRKRRSCWASAFKHLGVREPDDFNGVFEAMDREPPDAILMVSDVLTLLNRKRVFDYAAAKRIPAIYEDQTVRSRRRLDVIWGRSEGVFRARWRYRFTNFQGRAASRYPV